MIIFLVIPIADEDTLYNQVKSTKTTCPGVPGEYADADIARKLNVYNCKFYSHICISELFKCYLFMLSHGV